MRVRVRHFAAAFAGALALAAMASGHAVAQDDELPNSPGKDTLIEVCTQCHAIGIVIQQDRAPEEWDELMQRMVGMGAPATPDQQQAILAYLKKNFVKPATPAASASAGPARGKGLSRP
jgi:hypothetical protein